MAHVRRRSETKRPVRHRIHTMVISLVSVVWLTSGLARATEALPVMPEPGPGPPRLPPHAGPHVQRTP